MLANCTIEEARLTPVSDELDTPREQVLHSSIKHDEGPDMIRQLSFSLGFILLAACEPAAERPETPPAPDASTPSIIVNTEYGPVEGELVRGMRAFQGIPFAAPPVGDLRWAEPQPPTSWDEPLQTTVHAPICMQTPFESDPPGTPPPSEDCLYLNVWTPGEPNEAPLPVMIWIHGGGFTAGTAAHPVYTPDALVSEGVIYVAIAYRLGPFGFMAHPELSAESEAGVSGNYGLLDQIAALEWVQTNITAFGGDPANVTIFGESAGGMSVAALKVSPIANGLFDKVISQSGGFMAPPSESVNPNSVSIPTLAQAERLGEQLIGGLGDMSISEARALPAETLLAAPAFYAPVLDGHVLPVDVRAAYETGDLNDGPLLIGWNSDEGAMFIYESTPEAFEGAVTATYGEAAEAVLAAYPHATPEEALQSTRDLFRDGAFAWSSLQMARLLDETSDAPVYTYLFNQRLPVEPGALMYSAVGSTHASEISYVFGSFEAPVFGFDPGPPAYTDDDRALSAQMTDYWTNFAKTGDPNGEGLPLWPQYNASDEMLMELKAGPAPIALPDEDKLTALDLYFRELRASWLEHQPQP